MSCPSWSSLAAVRSRGAGGEAEWDAALAHLRSCLRCRERALAADPTLLFQRLPAPPLEEDEAARMKGSVRSTLRARAVEPRRRSEVRWATAAAASVLLLILSLAVGLVPTPREPVQSGSPEGLVVPVAVPLGDEGESGPLLDGIDRPGARVYQLREGNLSVVMIVDETLDV